MNEKKKRRIKELEEMIEIVILAIPRKIDSQKYYQKAIDKVSSDTIRELSKTFVMEGNCTEVNLRKILKDLKTELKQLKKSK